MMETQQRYFERMDRSSFYNTLAGVVKALENKQTVVDLRNDSCVYGLVANVDGAMNIEMEDVIFCDPNGNQYKFKSFYIHCRNIRYVHIPKQYPAKELMEQTINEMQASVTRPEPENVRTFKKQRAEKYQREILQQHYRSEPGPSSQPS